MFWTTVTAGVAAVLLVALACVIILQGGVKGTLVGIPAGGAATAVGVFVALLLLKKRVNTQTIRVRLRAGFFFMAILPAIGISLGSTILGYIDGRQQAISHLESVVALKDLELATWSQSLQDVLLAAQNEEYATERASVVLDLANSNKYSEYYSRAMRARLQIRVHQSPQIEELLLLDLTGRIVLSTEAEHEGQLATSQPFFKAALSGPFMQFPYQAPEDVPWPHEPWVFAARSVTDGDGQLLGIIAGRVATARLNEILGDRTGLGKTGKLYLVNAAGVPLFAEGQSLGAAPASEQMQSRSEAERTAGALRSATADASVEERVGRPGVYPGNARFRGTRVFGFYRRLSNLGVMLAAEQDLSEALRVIYATLAVNVGISLLAVLLASIAAFVLTRSITRPLVDLADTATRIAQGDLERVAPVQQDDEVGTLAVAFNAMTGQLRDLIVNLEHRVAERTRALHEAMRSERRRALQLETSAQVSREITSILANEELLPVWHALSGLQLAGFPDDGLRSAWRRVLRRPGHILCSPPGRLSRPRGFLTVSRALHGGRPSRPSCGRGRQDREPAGEPAAEARGLCRAGKAKHGRCQHPLYRCPVWLPSVQVGPHGRTRHTGFFYASICH